MVVQLQWCWSFTISSTMQRSPNYSDLDFGHRREYFQRFRSPEMEISPAEQIESGWESKKLYCHINGPSLFEVHFSDNCNENIYNHTFSYGILSINDTELNGNPFFTRCSHFRVREIEVFRIIDSTMLPHQSCSLPGLKLRKGEKQKLLTLVFIHDFVRVEKTLLNGRFYPMPTFEGFERTVRMSIC